jgi:hypothetical protein
MMNYTKNIDYLPKDFKVYEDFYDTFGFKEYQEPMEKVNQGVYLGLAQPAPVKITGYDLFVQTDIYRKEGSSGDGKICDFTKNGKKYVLIRDAKKEQFTVKSDGDNGQALLTFNMQEIYDRFSNYQAMKDTISVKDATFTKENSQAKITIVVQNVGIESQHPENNNALLNVFVAIK